MASTQSLSMDVVVVGSCMTDLVSYVPVFPRPGETVHGTKFCINFGGKGANQCIQARRLGAKTAMVAKLGDDTFGSNYFKNFKDNDVDTKHVTFAKGHSTGVAPIMVDQKGENEIAIVGGANQMLSAEDVQNAEDVIAGAKVVVCQLEVNPLTTLAALHMAKKHKVKSVFNPAPGVPDLDIICPNETEAELLTGIKVDGVESGEKAIRELQKRGCTTVVMTMGAKGCLFAADSQSPVEQVETTKVKAIDTTGAGDSFIGALAFYLSTRGELALGEAVSRASRVASVSVTAQGTQPSFQTKEQLPQELFS